MSDNKETIGENSTQSKEDVATNIEEKPMQEFNAGEFLDEQSPVIESPKVDTVGSNDENKGSEKRMERDRAGTIFNIDIHCVDENGRPSVTKTGYFRVRKGMKEKAKEQAQKVTATAIPLKDFDSPPKPGTLQMICFIIDNVTGVATATMGPQWKPTMDERTMLTDVWARYCEYKGWDLSCSPEFAIVMATSMYALPRLMISPFFKKLLGKKVVKNDAHGSNRPTGNGQDNVSPNNGEAVKKDSVSSRSDVRFMG